MRIFIAINLPLNIFEPINENLRVLEEGCKNYRWNYKENIHITLAFIGEIDEKYLPILYDVVEYSIKEIECTEFSTGNPVFFPFGLDCCSCVFQTRIGGIALSIENGNQYIGNMATIIEGNLIKIGLNNGYRFRPAEKRLYTPHITLARKGRNHVKYFPDNIDKMSFRVDGMITTITIFKSEIYKGNPQYTPLKVYDLKQKQN
jgi:2'-5' RNA ligase